MPLVIVAATTLLAVSRIGAVTARDTSTMTMSMITVVRLTGTAAGHHNIAAAACKIKVIARTTWTTLGDY